jgi:NAD(P)-dependent dehydrogenase (short-subunit alcohol dehydrogenase family)
MVLGGKVVAVTGAFGVLGLAVAAAASGAGAQVAMIGRGEPPAGGRLPDVLAKELLRGRVLMLGKVDLASFDAAQAALAEVVRHFGGLDVLANLAGAFRWQTLADGDLAVWDRLYEVNLRTTVVSSRAALPYLHQRGGGRIINVGAAAASHAGPGMGPYAAAKAGVAKLTESLAQELKDHNIGVNAILPSIIDTPANRADMPNADFSRWVTPAAVAEVIIFLASDSSRAVTGALLPVTGRV